MLEIKLPELGENIAQGTVSKILVKAGDSVKKGQNILELETDKAVLEVPSPQEGLVKEILIKTGQSVKVGQSVFVFDGKSAAASASPVVETKAASAAPQSQTPKTSAPTPSASPVSATGAVIEMNLPGLGENIVQGTVTKILVKKGDLIKKGQNILEMETDKAVLEVPSSMDGVVEEILIKAGQAVKVGQAAFKIKSTGATISVLPATTAQTTSAPAAKPET